MCVLFQPGVMQVCVGRTYSSMDVPACTSAQRSSTAALASILSAQALSLTHGTTLSITKHQKERTSRLMSMKLKPTPFTK